MDKWIIQALSDLIKAYKKEPKHFEGKILGSMTTVPDPLAIYAYMLFIHTNASDPVIFREIARMKDYVLAELNRFYNNRCKKCGLITSGGTESNFLALLIAKKINRQHNNVVLAPTTVHSSVDRACDVLGCKLVKIKSNNEPVDPFLVREYIRKYDPFAIVVTAGTTERGIIDPLQEISELSEEYDLYLHIDAAYGGLIIPSLWKHGLVDHNLEFFEGVNSISVDFHKNGRTPIPSGVLLFDDESYFEEVCYPAEYTLHGKYCGLLGTRPGASIASIYAMLRYRGFVYYEETALRMQNLAYYLYDRLREIKGVIAYKPILPIVPFKHEEIGYEYLLEKLLHRGYYLYKSPSLEALRVVIMPHTSRDHINDFVGELEHAIGSLLKISHTM